MLRREDGHVLRGWSCVEKGGWSCAEKGEWSCAEKGGWSCVERMVMC